MPDFEPLTEEEMDRVIRTQLKADFLLDLQVMTIPAVVGGGAALVVLVTRGRGRKCPIRWLGNLSFQFSFEVAAVIAAVLFVGILVGAVFVMRWLGRRSMEKLLRANTLTLAYVKSSTAAARGGLLWGLSPSYSASLRYEWHDVAYEVGISHGGEQIPGGRYAVIALDPTKPINCLLVRQATEAERPSSAPDWLHAKVPPKMPIYQRVSFGCALFVLGPLIAAGGLVWGRSDGVRDGVNVVGFLICAAGFAILMARLAEKVFGSKG